MRFVPILPSLPKESNASLVLSIVPRAMITLESGVTASGPRSVRTSVTRRTPASFTEFSRMIWQHREIHGVAYASGDESAEELRSHGVMQRAEDEVVRLGHPDLIARLAEVALAAIGKILGPQVVQHGLGPGTDWQL